MKKVIVVFVLVISITGLVFSDEIDEIRELLMAERGGDIEFLSKINLGFSTGDNWIASRSNGYTYIYTVNNEKEVEIIDSFSYAPLTGIKYWDTNVTAYVALEHDILQDIPGIKIGNKAAKFGDYNNDGIDEIFSIDSQSLCTIQGYDRTGNKMTRFFLSRFDILSTKGPAPVSFCNYNSVEGFKIHLWDYLKEQYVWIFFAWDEESRNYVELVRFGADTNPREYHLFMSSQNPDSLGNQRSVESTIGETDNIEVEPDQPEETIINEAGSNSDGRFNIGTVIIGVAVLAMVIVVLLVMRKEKK